MDSASVIWGLRGSVSLSSQWAYIRFHELVEELKDKGVSVRIRWCPGHEGIEGNEKADRLADLGAKGPADTDPRTQGANVSGIRSELRKAAREASARCWQARKPSDAYDRWKLEYNPTKESNELGRRTLGHYLAMRTGHGDFRGYHDRFAHQGAKTQCPWCDNSTAPDHLFHCPNSVKLWKKWPNGPTQRPNTQTRPDKSTYTRYWGTRGPSGSSPPLLAILPSLRVKSASNPP